MKKVVIRLALIGTLALSFAVFWKLRSHSSHFLGTGEEGPTQALTRFADALDHLDYHSLRELLFYQEGVCGGMDLMAVSVNNAEALKLSYHDHLSLLESSLQEQNEITLDAYRDLLRKNIAPYRWYMLHYIEYLRGLNLDEYADHKKITVNIPRLCYLDWPNQLVLDQEHDLNQLSLIQRRGRWYIFNFSCQAMGVEMPDEVQPDFSKNPTIENTVLLDMCALGSITTDQGTDLLTRAFPISWR